METNKKGDKHMQDAKQIRFEKELMKYNNRWQRDIEGVEFNQEQTDQSALVAASVA